MNTCFAAFNRAGKIALLMAGLSIFAPAHAGVIVDQSYGGALSGGGYTNEGTYWKVWDDFRLDSAAAINGISYFTRMGQSPSVNDYSLKIGTAAGKSDVLDIIIAKSGTTLTTITSGNRVDAAFSTVNLGAGTYWLSFSNPGNLTGSVTVAGGNMVQISSSGPAYTRSGSATAFMLTNTSAAVPEPGSLALLGLGVIGFAAARRKTSK